MLETVAKLAGGIAGLYFGSALVLARLPRIARAFGVSELVVTVLGISVLTSLPELAVSGFASATRGHAGAVSSIGNVLGSNFVTLTFVLSVCAMVRPFKVASGIRDRETTWMIISSASILVLAAMDGALSRLDGALLIAVYLFYLASIIREAAKDRLAASERERFHAVDILAVVAGMGLIVLGADFTVAGGSALGLAIGLDELAVGVIVFAAGTSLPELAVSLGASLKNKADVILGEVYASNIFTAQVVLGICLLIQPLDPVPHRVLMIDLPFLVLGAAVMQLFVTTGRTLERWEAALMLLFYGYYVYLHVG